MLDEDHGTGRYLASLDVFHELHCVVSTDPSPRAYALDGDFRLLKGEALQDLLRKSIHREYYDEHESSFAGAPQHIIEGHLGT